MECVILGSGTAVPHPRRGSSGILVQEKGFSLLVDSGMGTLQKLAILGISLAELDVAAYTHLHIDHTAELAPMLFALKNTAIGRRKPLPLFGGPGFREFHRKLAALYGQWIDPTDVSVRVEEIGEKPVPLGPLTLSAHPVTHTPQSVAYRIESAAGGTTVAISGDTDVCDGLVAAAREADVAVFECSFPDERKAEGHLTPSEAGRIAARAGVRTLVLTHFYPECEGVDLAAQCRRAFSGEIVLASDLLRLTLCGRPGMDLVPGRNVK